LGNETDEVSRSVAEDLKNTSERVGQLYPILVDYYGEIIDGQHRFDADEKWQKIRLKHVKTEKDRLIARIVGNTVRRTVPQDEKMQWLRRLGEILLEEGIEPGRITWEIVKKTGMSYRWVAKYLPIDFKDDLQSNRASSAARRATKILDELFMPPRRKGVVVIRNFANTDFISLALQKSCFEEFEKNSLELDISPEVSLLKALEDYNEKMKRAIKLRSLTIMTRACSLHKVSE
jgi:hypothetical protein